MVGKDDHLTVRYIQRCAIYNGVLYNGAPFNGALYNGAPFNGALYLMVYHIMMSM